jgi:2Fe-2S ferredoxin
MPKIHYLEHVDRGGSEHTVEAAVGQTVMEVAVQNGVPGIEAICGGSCACATCHVYVDDAWIERTGGASDMEAGMLEIAVGVEPNSRLSCQIRIRPELDGLIVRLPKVQA